MDRAVVAFADARHHVDHSVLQKEIAMSDTNTADTDPPDDEVELDIDSQTDAVEFVKHHVNVASNVKVVKKTPGAGYTGTASGFVGGPNFVPSTAKTGPSKAQAKTAAEAAINAGAAQVTLTKQADGTWTVT